MRDLSQGAARLFPVYVRSGLVWEGAEIHWLERFLATTRLSGCEPLSVLDCPVRDLYGDHWSTTGRIVPGFEAPVDSNYLPGRNLLLLSKAVVFCALHEIERLTLAPLAENPFPDASLEFFSAFEDVAARALGARIRIEVPLRALEKAEVIRRGRELPLALTFSCIRPDGFDHCGECTKCAERQRGFAAAGLADPTRYRRSPSA